MTKDILYYEFSQLSQQMETNSLSRLKEVSNKKFALLKMGHDNNIISDEMYFELKEQVAENAQYQLMNYVSCK